MSLMQKVFNLPVNNSGAMIEESSGNLCAKFNLPNEAKAAAHAINHVDALAESLEKITELAWLLSNDLGDEFELRPEVVQAKATLSAYRGEK